MRVLVVFFANTGQTRYVASEMARRCGGELEEVLDARPHAGACEALRYIWDSLTKKSPPVEAPIKDAADYDLVVLCTPVWAWHVSSPVRSYIQQNAQRFKRVAFFCTDDGWRGDKHVFAEMARLCDREPVATFVMSEPFLAEPMQYEPLQQFMSCLATA